MRRFLLIIVVAIGVPYCAAMAFLASQETRLIFAAGRPLAAGRPAAPFEQVELARTDGLQQFGWTCIKKMRSSHATGSCTERPLAKDTDREPMPGVSADLAIYLPVGYFG